ncbi:MAG: hypothetical protein ACLGI9_18095, partial [Thermoanaerobaculia bacterium]
DKDGGNKWVQVAKPWMGGADGSVAVMEKVHKAMFAKKKAGPLAAAPGEQVEDDVLLLKDIF